MIEPSRIAERIFTKAPSGASRIAPMGDEHTELTRTHDPLRAQMLAELLESEGIPVATPGLEHRSMLGVAGGFIEIVVRVPRRDWARAKELMDALDAAPLVEERLDEAPERISYDYREAARLEVRRAPKMRRVAIFAALMLPGGGHLYGGRWREALALALAQCAILVLSFAGLPLGAFVLIATKVADVVGAVWFCERFNRDVEADSMRTRAAGSTSWRAHAAFGAATLSLFWVAFASGPGAALLASKEAIETCEARARCGESVGLCLWRADRGSIESGSRCGVGR